MYLSRTNSLTDILLYLVLSSMWAVGGWLLVSTAFRLRRSERILSGLAAGFLLFISLGNLFAHFLSLPLAFWVASLVILLVGVVLAIRSGIPRLLDKGDWLAIPLLAALGLISLLFTLILRGEAIFDEYLHLPLISVMAAGDIPPHFYLDPAVTFAYHYGIQVYAASLVRLAGLFPWSAWDTSRALAIAFTLVLGWVWVRRVTRSRLAAWLGTILFTFGGGARWLLLLLPAPWLDWVSRSVSLVGTGLASAPNLAAALHSPWVIEGGGPVAYPFAFHDGIFVPVFFTLGSTGAMPFMTVLLLLLLLPRGRFTSTGVILWSLLFATLALSAEHLFAVCWLGILLVMGIFLIYRRRMLTPTSLIVFLQWGFVLLFSALLSLVQGGFITETARNLLASLTGTASNSINARGFSLRWPPALLDAHLGSLSIFNAGQLVALLAELGPALLIVPVIFLRLRKQLSQRDWFSSGLALSVGISLVFPLLFKYGVDRSTTRLPATALWTSLVLGFPILWLAFFHSKLPLRLVLGAGFIILLVGGVVIFRTQLFSIQETEYTYFVDELDASMAADYWNKLPPHAQVLDAIASRSVTLFGRPSLAYSSIYDPLPAWEALVANPDPRKVAQAGYDYIYMDNNGWSRLSSAQKAIFQQSCVDVMEDRKQPGSGNFRLLANVSACK